MSMSRFFAPFLCAAFFTFDSSAADFEGITRWIDADTGRQVRKIVPETYATLPYFTANSVSSDGRFMVYVTGKGLNLLNLQSFATENIVAAGSGEVRCVEMGRKSNRLFYMRHKRMDSDSTLESIDLASRKITVHARLSTGYVVETINADETLAAGAVDLRAPDDIKRSPKPVKRGQLLYERAMEKIPMALFTTDLSSGLTNPLYQSTEWLSHPQFSPSNPNLLMYSIEGPWHLVNRIWTIRTDGGKRTLIHHRNMPMEIAGHEFWSKDGKEIIYDWQHPKGSAFSLAFHNVSSGQRRAIALDRNQWSIHFNSSHDPLVLVGDGADRSQVARAPDSAAILLYRIETNDKPARDKPMAQQSLLRSEKLVDLRGHDYQLEPNARLTPRNDWVIFRSNMFGTPSVFAVEVKKNTDSNIQKHSTYELSKSVRAARGAVLMEN